MHNIDNRVKWQIECDNLIKEKENVILSSPTGSGKTKRYEIWALNKPERPIFITSPIKALSNQKFRQLQAAGYSVGLETGDIKYIPSDDCDIICCTQEIYNNKYTDYKNSTLIIDEFSYIFEDEERARVYIDSLKYSESKNIMICSATFGNTEEIKNYINKVTNREFFLYKNNDRLTSLEYKGEIGKENIKDSLVVAYSKTDCEIIAKSIYNDRFNKYQKLLNKNFYANYDPRNRNKKEILKLAKKYNIDSKELIELATIGVIYYYGSLYPKEKLFVEELFENRLIDTVVGTDALALGVNFPIKNVIFTQLQKFKDCKTIKVSKNLFEQLSGRAGRKGYFDKGYVYYCNDFLENYDKYKKRILKELFLELVNATNEKVEISLTANIKDVLMGEISIEEEAKFIVNYSTTDKKLEEEYNKIRKTIDFVTSFDVAGYYLKQRFPNLKFDEGYYKAIENCTQNFKNKIEKLSTELMLLQPYFEKDIGVVYLPEYSAKKNCAIFVDILLEVPIEDLIKKYGGSFRNILLLRKYIYNLPKKYGKCYDISLIDSIIDSMDYTVLHPDEFKINKACDTIKKETDLKKQNINSYRCPNYFEIISIDETKYIKILNENNNMLVCDYSSNDTLKLQYIPLNTKYKLVGFVKLNQRLEVLNKVDLSSSISEDKTVINKIEGMKLFLKKKRK